MRSYQDFWEIIFLQTERYIGETADCINYKEWIIPLPEFFGPTQLSQQSSEVFFSDQFSEHVLILISPLFPVPGKLPDRKSVVRRCNAQTGKFADIQVQFIKSWCGKRVISNGPFSNQQ